MASELKKEFKVEGNTIRCTNRETKAEAGGKAYTFDIVIDFTGLCEVKDVNETLLGWAIATAVIRAQNALRKMKAAEVNLAKLEREKVYTVKATDVGKITMTREPTEAEIKAAMKAKLAGMTQEEMIAYINSL